MDAPSGEPGDLLRAAGFRQGSVLDSAAMVRLGLDSFARFDVAVVVTHDCDLVRPESVEPSVEVIGASFSAADGNLMHGRNPRTLVLGAETKGAASHLRLEVRDRTSISKAIAAELRPNPEIVVLDRDVRLLASWVAKRYARAAFPDAFNERLRASDQKLERLFKRPVAQHVSQVLFMLEPAQEELGAESVYRLAVWVVLLENAMHDPALAKERKAFESDLGAALKSCNGISVEELELRAETDVTLADLRLFRRYDKDYRSHATPGSALPTTTD